MGFEEQLSKSILSGPGDRTFIDKVLSKDDIEAIKTLMMKDRLSRSELLELLYRIASTESKLINLGEWDRYLILKFYVWIREFVKVAEQLYDYKENIEVFTKKCICGGELTFPKEDNSKPLLKCSFNCSSPKQVLEMPKSADSLLDNNIRLIEHNVKFLVDLYLNICRTSLSLGMSGFKEVLTNKYEVMYPNQSNTTDQQNKGGFLTLRR